MKAKNKIKELITATISMPLFLVAFSLVMFALPVIKFFDWIEE